MRAANEPDVVFKYFPQVYLTTFFVWPMVNTIVTTMNLLAAKHSNLMTRTWCVAMFICVKKESPAAFMSA